MVDPEIPAKVDEQKLEALARDITGGRSICALKATGKLDPSLPAIVMVPFGPEPSARPLRLMDTVIEADPPALTVPEAGDTANDPVLPLTV